MYFYLFDSWLQDRKYQADISKIEARLNTLGIRGRSEKITILKNIHEAVRDGIKRGATTVVLVGNDKTVTTVLPDLLAADVTIGLIPMGQPQTIADFLGLSAGATACDSIARRVIARVDVGQANNRYFLLNANLPVGSSVQCDGAFTVTSQNPDDEMVIANLELAGQPGHPADGRLELFVRSTTKRGWGLFGKSGQETSVFPIQKAKVTSPPGRAQLLLDGQISVPTPLTIEVAKKKLSIIVGRQRHF